MMTVTDSKEAVVKRLMARAGELQAERDMMEPRCTPMGKLFFLPKLDQAVADCLAMALAVITEKPKAPEFHEPMEDVEPEVFDMVVGAFRRE